MSQKTLISFYQKKQKKNKERISDLLSGKSSVTKAKKRRNISTSSPVAEASTPTEASTSAAAASTSAAATSTSETAAAATSQRTIWESEMEDVLIATPFIIESNDEESPTIPLTRARKRRRTEKGREEQHSEQYSDRNFS